MTRTVTSAPLTAASIPKPAPAAQRLRPVLGGRMKLLLALVLGLALLLALVGPRIIQWRRSASAAESVSIYSAAAQTFDVSLKEKGELKAAKSTEVMCEVEGKSTIITLIPEGVAVKTGDLLVELASDQIVDRIRETELKEANAVTTFEAAKTELEVQRDKNASDIRKASLLIELKRLELEKYQLGEWAQKLKDAEIAIEQAQISLKRRTEDFEAAKELRAKNFITETEYKEDEFNHQRAKWELEKSTKAKEVLEEYTHRADLRQRQSDLEEAEKEFGRVQKNAEAEETKKGGELDGKKKELELIRDQLAKLRSQKEKCRIFAPTDGFVVYYSEGGGRFMSSDSQIREGASVHERQILLTLPNTSEMVVVVRVHEAKTDKLNLGQKATVQVEGLPGHVFSGTVTKIAAVADTQNRWLNPDLKEYETEIALERNDVALKPGVTAYCEILVERVEEKLAIPVHTVYSKGSRRYVFRGEGREVKPVEVKLGAIGTEWAEITSGLTAGDRVLLAFNDDHKRLISEPRGEDRENGTRGNGAGDRPAMERRGDRPPGGGPPGGIRRIQGPASGSAATATPGPSGPSGGATTSTQSKKPASP